MSLLLRSEPFMQCEPTFIRKAAEQQGSLNIVTFQFGPIAEVVERIVNGILDWRDTSTKLGVVLRYLGGIVLQHPEAHTLPPIEDFDPCDPLATYKGVLRDIYKNHFNMVLFPELRNEMDAHAVLELSAAGISCLTTLSAERDELIEPRLFNIGLQLTQIDAILR